MQRLQGSLRKHRTRFTSSSELACLHHTLSVGSFVFHLSVSLTSLLVVFIYLPALPRRAEYQRNKEAVINMLLQVVMNIENPYEKQQ